MPNEILLGLIASFSSICGSIIGCFATNKLTIYRLEQLEKKVDSLQATEQRIALLEQRINQYERRKDM